MNKLEWAEGRYQSHDGYVVRPSGSKLFLFTVGYDGVSSKDKAERYYVRTHLPGFKKFPNEATLDDAKAKAEDMLALFGAWIGVAASGCGNTPQ